METGHNAKEAKEYTTPRSWMTWIQVWLVCLFKPCYFVCHSTFSWDPLLEAGAVASMFDSITKSAKFSGSCLRTHVSCVLPTPHSNQFCKSWVNACHILQVWHSKKSSNCLLMLPSLNIACKPSIPWKIVQLYSCWCHGRHQPWRVLLVFKSQVPSCVFFGLKSRYLTFIFSGLQSHHSQGHLGNFSNCFTCNGRFQGGEHPPVLRCERLPVGRRYLLCSFFFGNTITDQTDKWLVGLSN